MSNRHLPPTNTRSVASPTLATTANITPADIPPGYGYPGDRAAIQASADTWKIDQITQHTWDMWAGMTADSGQSYNGSKLPYWDTWCGTEEVFGGSCGQGARPAIRSGGFATHPRRPAEGLVVGPARHPGRLIQQVQSIDGPVHSELNIPGRAPRVPTTTPRYRA